MTQKICSNHQSLQRAADGFIPIMTSINGILESDSPNNVLLLLLDERVRQIDNEMKDRKKQLDSIKVIKESLRHTDRIPVNLISDIEYMMKSKKKLKRTHITMIVMGLLMDAVEIGTLALWIIKGIWQPFAIGILC